MEKRNALTIFEHDILRVGDTLDARAFRSLARFHDKICDSYFDLGFDCVKFKQYVGIIRVDDLTIEVLPKIDRDGYGRGTELWRTALLEILAASGFLRADILSNALQSVGKTPLLDIIALQFLAAEEILAREGLLRKYRREAGNVSALKGKLLFTQHVNRNLTKPDKWFTDHSVYDRNHALNGILRLALDILYAVCSSELKARLFAVRLDFLDIPPFHPDSAFMDRLSYDRRTERYREAIDIAWLIVRNLGPAIRYGDSPVFALMFDMNNLFERTVLHLLTVEARRRNDGTVVLRPESRRFWNRMYLRPDILIQRENERIIIDTKWKLPATGGPDEHDLRQVFTYGLYFSAGKVILLYPGTDTDRGLSGKFEPVPAFPNSEVRCEKRYSKLVTTTGRLDKDFAHDFFSELFPI